MADLEFHDAYLGSAARLLTDAAASLRGSRAMPMLSPESYTGIGATVQGFMQAVTVAVGALSDAAGEGAAAVAGVMAASTEIENEIARVLGPGFTGE